MVGTTGAGISASARCMVAWFRAACTPSSVKAAAVDRDHPYGKALDDFRNGDPLVLEVATVDREGSVESTGSITTERSVGPGRADQRGQPAWYEWTITHRLRVSSPKSASVTAPPQPNAWSVSFPSNASEHPEVAPFADMETGLWRNPTVCSRLTVGPKLRIYDIRVEGPHIDQWPPAGHTLMYGDLQPDELNRSTITQRLRSVRRRCFSPPACVVMN